MSSKEQLEAMTKRLDAALARSDEILVTVGAERDRYRLVLELIVKRNKLMNPALCLDMLEKEAKRALGNA